MKPTNTQMPSTDMRRYICCDKGLKKFLKKFNNRLALFSGDSYNYMKAKTKQFRRTDNKAETYINIKGEEAKICRFRKGK